MTVDIKTAIVLARRALMLLTNNIGIYDYVYTDYKNEIGVEGKTIQIRKPATFVSNKFDPVAGVTVQDPDEDMIDMTLDNWEEVTFRIPDFENSTQPFQLIDRFMQPALIAIGESIETSVLKTIAYGVTNSDSILGSPNVTMNGDGIIDAQTQLFIQKAPIKDTANMTAVIGPRSRGALLKDKYFNNADYSGGTADARDKTVLRDQLGFKYWPTQLIPKPVPGDAAGNTGATATVGNGTSTSPIPMTNMTVAPPEGTILTFAGHTAKYVVDKGTTNVSLVLKSGLLASVANNEAITFITGEQNTLFHKNAVALCMRPLESAAPGVSSVTHVESYGGYSVRVELFRDSLHKQDLCSLDALWTTKMIQPELAVKYLGQG